jgi:hypothetical protein
MAVLTGQRHTANVAASQRVIDLHKPILLRESNPDGPDQAPLAVLTKSYNGGLMREKARDPKFSWHNDQLMDRFDAINDATPPLAAGTTWTVDNGDKFTEDDLVYVPRTEEVVLVTAITGDDLTVTRSVGSVAAADLADDDPLYIIATAAEEGTLPRVATSENPVKVDNYTEIFKQTMEASGTWLSSSNESTPHDWNHNVRKKFLEHYKDIEGAAWFGAADELTGADGKPQRTTGGALSFMTENNSAAGGAWTLTEVNDFIRLVTRYGSKTKTVFCSRLVASVLDTHSLNKLQTSVGDETFGVSIKQWQSVNGTINIIPHPLFEGSPELDGLAVALDFKAQAVGYRYLAGDGPGGGRDTQVQTNVEEPGRDGRRDQILAECGFRYSLPETGGVVTGVTSAA